MPEFDGRFVPRPAQEALFDSALTTEEMFLRLHDELSATRALDGCTLRLTLHGHRLTVEGTVRHLDQKKSVEAIARKVPGIAEILNLAETEAS